MSVVNLNVVDKRLSTVNRINYSAQPMQNEIMHHAVKAIRFRFRKATENPDADFANFKVSEHTRSPRQIIYHMFDLALKTQSMIREGTFANQAPEELSYKEEVERFSGGLRELEQMFLSTIVPLEMSKKLLQGPILDMASHVGQIAMLSGMHGHEIGKVSYFSADLNAD